jgi:hypothetical protein
MTAVISSGVLVGTSVSPVWAWAPGEPLTTWNALEQVAVSALEPGENLLADVAHVETEPDGSWIVDDLVGDVRVGIPLDPHDAVVLDRISGPRIALVLPYARSAGGAVSLAPGVAEFDNWNGSSTVPIVKTDGSVQIATVVRDAEAPTRYTLTLDLPPGAKARSVEGRSVAITGVDDRLLGGFAPVWAFDATGMSVPVRYEVSGSRVTVVVEHGEIPAIYPVVASAWLGLELYSEPRISAAAEGYRVEITPTPWGAANNGLAMWWAHRDEVAERLGGPDSPLWSVAAEEQLYCQIADLPATRAGFRLEPGRRASAWPASGPYPCDPPERRPLTRG